MNVLITFGQRDNEEGAALKAAADDHALSELLCAARRLTSFAAKALETKCSTASNRHAVRHEALDALKSAERAALHGGRCLPQRCGGWRRHGSGTCSSGECGVSCWHAPRRVGVNHPLRVAGRTSGETCKHDQRQNRNSTQHTCMQPHTYAM